MIEGHPGWRAAGIERPGAQAASDVWAFLRAVGLAPALPPQEPAERDARRRP
jgi:hypothetical protein